MGAHLTTVYPIGVYLISEYLTGVSSHGYVPYKPTSHGRAPHGRASHGHAPYRRVPHGVHFMGVHLIGVYLMGVHHIDVYFMDVYIPDPLPYKRWCGGRFADMEIVRRVQVVGCQNGDCSLLHQSAVPIEVRCRLIWYGNTLSICLTRYRACKYQERMAA